MEHFPGRGLGVFAPPVDSSLTRGFGAEGMPFQSYCGVSASSAPANGGTDVAHSHLFECVCVFAFLGSISTTFMCCCGRSKVCIPCRSRSPCFSGSSFVLALPSAVDFPSVSDSHVSVCASVRCLVPLTFLKSADC